MQVRELCSIKPQELHLLPFYARIAASTSALFPTVGEAIAQAAETHFNSLRVRLGLTEIFRLSPFCLHHPVFAVYPQFERARQKTVPVAAPMLGRCGPCSWDLRGSELELSRAACR